MSGRAWRVDYGAVVAARESLGIDLAVIVDVTDELPGHQHGRYTGVHATRDAHVVMIRSDLDYSVANWVLWHEIAHAAQAEEWAKAHPDLAEGAALEAFEEEWFHQMAAVGISREQLDTGTYDGDAYASTPFERMANTVADRRNETHLVVPLRATEDDDDVRLFDAMDRALGA